MIGRQCSRLDEQTENGDVGDMRDLLSVQKQWIYYVCNLWWHESVVSLQCEGSETVARNQQNNVAVYTQVRTGPVSEVQSLELRTWIRCVLHRYQDSGPHRILGNKIDQVLATDCCVQSIWLSVCAVLVSVRVILLSLLSIKINNRKRIEYLHKRQDESNKSACDN